MTFAEKRTKPRLLYVENFLLSFQSSRLSVALAAATQGFDVHVAVPLAGTGAAGLDSAVEWHDLAINRNLSLHGDAKTLGSLITLYRQLHPDLVHHIRPKAIVYGSFAAQSLRIRAVVNMLTGLGHVFHTNSIRARLLRTPVTVGLRLACHHVNQRLVVQNTEDFEICLRSGICPANRLVLIKGSGVDLEKYRPLPEPEGTVLVILPGRMLWDKGVREFVAAAEQLRDSGLRARFALVGRLDPDSPAALTAATLKGWEEAGTVEWWGWRKDMNRVIAQSHIVCLPSYGEGAPRALMEAAACARAIVTTDVAGCRDVVIDGKNGLLVPSRDTRALATALGVLITQPELRSRLASNGRQMMEEDFSLRAVIAKNLAVYREVLGLVHTPPGMRPCKENSKPSEESRRDRVSAEPAQAGWLT